jgi:hypothetical protein
MIVNGGAEDLMKLPCGLLERTLGALPGELKIPISRHGHLALFDNQTMAGKQFVSAL